MLSSIKFEDVNQKKRFMYHDLLAVFLGDVRLERFRLKLHD